MGTACSFPADKQTGVDAPPLKEEDEYPASPESAYGWSKLMGEYEALLMEKEAGIPVSVLVLHNVYGAPCDFSPERSQVIPSLIRKFENPAILKRSALSKAIAAEFAMACKISRSLTL